MSKMMDRGKFIGLAAKVLMCVCAPSLAFADTIQVSGTQFFSDAVFNFDADLFDKPTPFSDTVGGVEATFTSSGDPGGFAVTPFSFSSLTGNVLLAPGPAGLNNLTLTIVFSGVQTSISMNFATNSEIGTLFKLDAFNGTSAVGSAAATGIIPSGFSFPEGVISFSGSAFNSVVLSSPEALDFAIDNVTVKVVSEPGSLLLLLFGALGIITKILWTKV